MGFDERLDLADEGGYLPGIEHDVPDDGPPIEDWWSLEMDPFDAGVEIGEALFYLAAADTERARWLS